MHSFAQEKEDLFLSSEKHFSHTYLAHTKLAIRDAAYATQFAQLADDNFVIGYHDGLIKQVNPRTKKEKILHAASSKLRTLLPLNREKILSNHEDGKTYLWSKKVFQPIQKFATNRVSALLALPNNIIAMGVIYSNILLFDIDANQEVANLGTPSLHVSDALTLLPSGQLMSCRNDTGTFYIWDIETQRRLSCFRTHADLYSQTLFADGKHMATSHRDGNIYVWHIQSEQCVAHVQDTSCLIHSIASLPNGYLATGNADGNIKIWDIFNETCKLTISVKKNRVRLTLPTYVSYLLRLSDGRLGYLTNHDTGILDLTHIHS